MAKANLRIWLTKADPGDKLKGEGRIMKKSLIATVVALFCAANICLAGGRVAISVNPAGCWRPAPAYCAPVYRPCLPVSYYSSYFFYSSWPDNAFTTISTPGLNQSAPPVYSVPAPVFQTAAVTTYPNASFSWKR